MARFEYSPSVAIHYEVHGSGEIPVLLLHGYVASLATWHDLSNLFPPDRYRLYLLDLKGFGRSSKPPDGHYAVADQAAIVQAFMTHLELRRVVLIGHSMGGSVALLTALRFCAPGMDPPIHRLILIDCAAFRQEPPRFMTLMTSRLLAGLILWLIPTRIIIRHVLRAIFRNRAAITPERIARYAAGLDPQGIVHSFSTTVQELVPPDYEAIVAGYARITLPTLIIWGDNDPIVSPAMGARLQQAMPHACLALIDSCGHNPHEERPAETYGAIAAFLDA